ncbi:accessory Sec system glycosyltransferase Asp1 [Staphylococcus auricularis]|uniref:accessory Sec system glycosyltransferase Asp1 n=1 Tax=Staphylococcus auricularis TaxID=29379 RepID=UPI00124816E5|nr:accessory Sec system glycosyltransferase Asp1 [Staphylococcus auricularis]
MCGIGKYDEKGEDVNEEYMRGDGDWILREDLVRKEMVVSDKYGDGFDEGEYGRMTELMEGELKDYSGKEYEVDDVRMAAGDEGDNGVISENMGGEDLWFWIYSEGNKEVNDETLGCVDKGQ